MQSKVQKLVMAIKSAETMEVLERWQFDIHNTEDPRQLPPIDLQSKERQSIAHHSQQGTTSPTAKKTPEKSEKEIQSEIQAILRQITASVTFLPMLDEQ